MFASVQNRSRHFSPAFRVNVRIAKFYIKKKFFSKKVLIVQKTETFQSIVFDF